jgi:hypothetical protein
MSPEVGHLDASINGIHITKGGSPILSCPGGIRVVHNFYCINVEGMDRLIPYDNRGIMVGVSVQDSTMKNLRTQSYRCERAPTCDDLFNGKTGSLD